jgi:subtilisin family serine protease
MKKNVGALMLSSIAAIVLALFPVAAQQQDFSQSASTARFHRQGVRAIPNHYIVVLDNDASGRIGNAATNARMISQLMPEWAGTVTRRFDHAINGFAAYMTEEQALALSQDDRVAFVEEDSIMEALVTQSSPPSWGIDRIDETTLPLSRSYSYTRTGAGVTAYIIDTGIRTSHTQFGGRARVGFDAIGDGRNGIDCNGHGTHVSGTVGGSTFGVAKSVSLVAVRVLSCSGSGSTSGVIAGVDFVTANHQPGQLAVANMSLGGGASTALDNAVSRSIADGVVYAIAAGNSNANAANSSPARVAAAITVGSSTINDQRSSFSNFGSVVDIFAPGSSIVSAWFSSDMASATLSGTSMATPHVAGVAARVLQDNPTLTPAGVRNAIVNAATLNRLAGIPGGTANRLLFWSGSH